MGNQTSNPNETSKELLDEEIAVLKEISHHSEERIRELYEEFKRFCPSGKIQKNDYLNYYKQNAGPNNKSYELIERLFHIFDKNRDGMMDFTEFVLSDAIIKQNDRDRILEISFALVDKSNSGYISYSDVVNYGKMIEALRNADDEDADENSKEFASFVFQKLGLNEGEKISKQQFIEGCKNSEHLAAWFGNIWLLFEFMKDD